MPRLEGEGARRGAGSEVSGREDLRKSGLKI